MTRTCETDGCDKAAQIDKDVCSLCRYRQKDGDAEFNALGDRMGE